MQADRLQIDAAPPDACGLDLLKRLARAMRHRRRRAGVRTAPFRVLESARGEQLCTRNSGRFG